MFRFNRLGAVVAAAAAWLWASQASAATRLIFEVGLGGAGTFQQTWILDDGAPGSFTNYYNLTGGASATASPVSASYRAATHVTDDLLNGSYEAGNAVDLADPDFGGAFSFMLQQGGSAQFDLDADHYATSTYYVQILGQSYGLPNTPTSPTMGDLTAFLGSDRFLWVEHSEASRHKRNGDYDGDLFVNDTFGYARLISATEIGAGAAPEPGTWALLILGFGMAAVALRRSRERSAWPGRSA